MIGVVHLPLMDVLRNPAIRKIRDEKELRHAITAMALEGIRIPSKYAGRWRGELDFDRSHLDFIVTIWIDHDEGIEGDDLEDE